MWFFKTVCVCVCLQVIGYSDTDVAEYIYKSKPDLVSLVNHLCKDLTDACTKTPPPLPKVSSYTLLRITF